MAGRGRTDGANLERRLVALYRFAAVFFDALAAIREPECRAALVARWFTAGDPTEAEALASLRHQLGNPTLRASELRGLYAQGVSSTFVVLRGENALGRVFDIEVERGLLRALEVDERVDVDLQTASLKIVSELVRSRRRRRAEGRASDRAGDADASAGNADPLIRDVWLARSTRTDDAANSAARPPSMNLTPLSPPLFVDYAGRRYHVASMRFVIGRDPKTCHLVLPDASVSRQHAIVEWVNGLYYLVDQGSANGTGCNGHRIHRKQIVEGDRFEICGHSIVFTYRMR